MIKILPWACLTSLKENEFAICFDDEGMLNIVKKSKEEGYFTCVFPESEYKEDRSIEDTDLNRQSLNAFKYDSFMVISKEILKELIKKI